MGPRRVQAWHERTTTHVVVTLLLLVLGSAALERVSAGSGPSTVVPEPSQLLGAPNGLPPRWLAAAPGASAGQSGTDAPSPRGGPAMPQVGPVPPPARPAPPGDRPPAQRNFLAGATSTSLAPAVADIPVRAYVPNSDADTLTVIDPNTFQIIARYATGAVPNHVTPSWDMTKLYVGNTSGNILTVLDPASGKPTGTVSVVDPYNLYFTPDGAKAIVVAERLQRLDYRDPHTWALIKSVPIPGAGVDHMDFSADGRFLIASDEFSGDVVKVDNDAMAVAGQVHVGGLPVDVKMSPDGSVFYVTNQGRHGVSVIDPDTMVEIAFLPTGLGAHGLNYSRDTSRLFVSNRLGGSISVIDVASRAVTETWKVGGSPDMLQVSADGGQLWASNRFDASVSVIDTSDGHVVKTIPTGAGAHGVSLFPQPGSFSVGHNGVYR